MRKYLILAAALVAITSTPAHAYDDFTVAPWFASGVTTESVPAVGTINADLNCTAVPVDRVIRFDEPKIWTLEDDPTIKSLRAVDRNHGERLLKCETGHALDKEELREANRDAFRFRSQVVDRLMALERKVAGMQKQITILHSKKADKAVR